MRRHSKYLLRGQRDNRSRGFSAHERILILLFGQSNAESHATSSTLSASNTSFASTYANVTMTSQQDQTFGDDPMVWVNSGTTTLGTTTFNPTGGAMVPCVGFEVSMMRDLDIAGPGTFAIARIAVGGSSSTQWDPSSAYPTSPPGGPNLFTQAVTFIQNALNSCGCSRVVLAWEQGESDAKTTAAGDAYLAWLGVFVPALRTALGNIGPGGTAIPFVYGKLNADADAATYLGKANLRASQVSFESTLPNLKLVNQDSITVASGLYDGTHYTADGYVSVGHLFSPAVAAYCGIRIQPVASFAYSASALAVTFTDTSVSYGDTVTAWSWNFGDGATSTAQNPSHTYASSGTYNVTLTVTNSHGDTNTSAATAVSVISGFAGVSRDSLSGWYVPATTAEWTTFLTDISSTMSTPDSIYLLQEASGNPADSGPSNLALTAVNTPAYQQAVSGWTRKAITFTDGTAKALQTTAAGLPDISTTSMLTLAFALMPASAPAGSRGVIAQGTSASTRSANLIQATGKLGVESTTAHLTSAAAGICDGAVHCVIHQTDRTNLAVVGYTEADKVVPVFGSTMTGKGFYLGAESGALTTFGGGFLYVAQWFGTKAEVTSGAIKTLFQGLTGLTVTWS